MTSPFHPPIRTAEEIAEHKAQRIAEAVARKLEGRPEPKMPSYQGSTPRSLAKHREMEIELTTDLGWGDPKAIVDMKHHAREARLTAESHACHWEMNTKRGGRGGWNNLSKHAIDMIAGLRSRIDPAIKVAEAEFDPDFILRDIYEAIESTHLDQVRGIKKKYDQMREGAGKYARSKIRKHEQADIQGVLNSSASAIRHWEAKLHGACPRV